MKYSTKNSKLLIVLISVLIFILLYIYGYNDYSSRSEELEQSLSEQKAILSELLELESNVSKYEEHTAIFKENIKNQLDTHPQYIEDEEFILWTLDWLSQTEVTTISLSDASTLEPIELYADVANEEGEVNYQKTMVTPGMISMTTATVFSYDGLKQAINSANSDKNNTEIENIVLSYDASTGNILTNVTISKYFLNYEGGIYNKEPMPTVDIGTDNIFGSIE